MTDDLIPFYSVIGPLIGRFTPSLILYIILYNDELHPGDTNSWNFLLARLKLR